MDGAWFIKQVTITPVDSFSAVVTVVLEHEGTREVRQIGQQVEDVPGTALRFMAQNSGGLGADEQAVIVTVTLDGTDVNPMGVAQMKLLVDPLRGKWDQNDLVWKW